MQWWQRDVQKCVMHLQSCCFVVIWTYMYDSLAFLIAVTIIFVKAPWYCTVSIYKRMVDFGFNLFDGVLQVHKLFALLNLSHAYVTTLGRLVGVVALKEVSRDHADSRAIFLWPWKMVSLSVCYLFYQPMDEKIKTWPLRFPTKENPNMEKALFDWPIVLQYDVKAKYWLNSRKLFGHEVSSAKHLLNQPKAMRVCICSMYQSNHYISVCLLFLFCLRVFIKRSYKNRSIRIVTLTYCMRYATSNFMKIPESL